MFNRVAFVTGASRGIGREIARARGISVANVNTQFHRLKRRVRDILDGNNVDETLTDSRPERPTADAQGVTRPQRKRR